LASGICFLLALFVIAGFVPTRNNYIKFSFSVQVEIDSTYLLFSSTTLRGARYNLSQFDDRSK